MNELVAVLEELRKTLENVGCTVTFICAVEVLQILSHFIVPSKCLKLPYNIGPVSHDPLDHFLDTSLCLSALCGLKHPHSRSFFLQSLPLLVYRIIIKIDLPLKRVQLRVVVLY